MAGTLCERDIPNNGGYTPLAWAIVQTHLDVAEFLLHSGAKMSNVKSRHKIPDWMEQIVIKRKNVILSTFTLKAVLRKRFRIEGAEAAFLKGRIPKDVVNLVGFYVWATRLDPEWSEASEDGLKSIKK